MSKQQPLADRVRNAWRCATEENGHDFLGWTPLEIAEDMVTYDADLEDEDPAAIAAILERMGEE